MAEHEQGAHRAGESFDAGQSPRARPQPTTRGPGETLLDLAARLEQGAGMLTPLEMTEIVALLRASADLVTLPTTMGAHLTAVDRLAAIAQRLDAMRGPR